MMLKEKNRILSNKIQCLYIHFLRLKSELTMRSFEKCLCFTLASINYYEDILHKFSILLVYFPLASGGKILFDISTYSNYYSSFY